MPNSLIKSFAEKSGKSIEEVENLWEKAKVKAKEAGAENEYAYIVTILKKMLGLKEDTLFEGKFTDLLEAKFFSIPEDDFTEYAHVYYTTKDEAINIERWLMRLIDKTKDYFIKEALIDVLDGVSKNKSYKAGINFIYGTAKFSIYSKPGIFVITSTKAVNYPQLKKLFKS